MSKMWIICCVFAGFFLTVVKADDKDKIFIGHWELQSNLSSEDYNEYLTAMEYNETCRENIRSTKTLMFELSKNDDIWTYEITARRTTEPMKSSFEDGKEFEESILDGRKVKTIATFGDKKLTRVQKMGDFESVQVLDFTEEECIATLKAKDKTAVLKFKRVTPAVAALLG